MSNFQILDHPTDLKIKVRGKTKRDLFQNAALALFHSLDQRFSLPKASSQWRAVEVQSADAESLLVDWLSELIGLHEINNENYFEIKILTFTEKSLQARVRGVPSIADRFDIKAATYHGLQIKKMKNGYEVKILFDI